MSSSKKLWPDGRPPLPTAMDWSCHGSLGWTLQQALDEMDRNARHHHHDPAGATATADKNDAPGSEDDEKSADSSRAKDEQTSTEGSDNATTTTNAAQEDTNEATRKPSGAAAATTTSRPLHCCIRATPQMRQAVLEALATAPARMNQAPQGLLKGRIKFYQRQGTRWRFEIDKVRIRRRVPLPKVRRKQEKPSLWDLSRESRQEQDKQVSNNTEPSKWSFELLAYEDIE